MKTLNALLRTQKLIPSLGLVVLMLQAQTQGRFALTVDNIMRGPALVGYQPSQVRWSGDSQRIYFEWKRYTDKPDAPSDTYVVGRDGSGLQKLNEEESKLAPPAAGDTTEDKRLTVYARDGDIFLYDSGTGATRRVTKTSDAESNPRFTRDGKHIYFTRSSNLYLMALDENEVEQLTDIRAAGSPAPGEQQKGTDSQEYLKREQKELLDVIRRRTARREEDEARRKRDNPRKPFTLRARQSVTSLQLSPDMKWVTAVVSEGGNAKNTIIPNFVTESGYTDAMTGRQNVGDTQFTVRLAVIDVTTGESKWVDHGQKRTQTPDEPIKTESEGAGQKLKPSVQDREVLLSQPVWSKDGAKGVLMGRAADNKDRWIFALDPATGKTRVLTNVHDDAWVDGPGASLLGWMKNDHEVYFQSEQSGYSHLYAVPFDGGEAHALTSGSWEVLNVQPSVDKSKFYLITNQDSPYENHLYVMDGGGGPLTRLTKAPGKHAVTLSPDERWFADIYSFTNKPPELFVQENLPEAESRRLTASPAPEFSQYPWVDPPIVGVPARDGVKVPARLFKPANFPKGGPAVIFIHGSGYAQNVNRWWVFYYRDYLFHHILMARGFLVIDVDYRGSSGYGRDWRTAVYQHMGGKDLDDIVDAARYVVAQHGVNPRKVGLYGGSYGGFLTLMGMFTQSDVFAAGAAQRPVTDWAYYNHGYTSNILNLPQDNAEAYRTSSPIYFAQGLKGALLICHGMADTNVEFQDTVRLAQKLIELGKENWEVAVYPAENHAFAETSSWVDEYKRILKLFEQNLR